MKTSKKMHCLSMLVVFAVLISTLAVPAFAATSTSASAEISVQSQDGFASMYDFETEPDGKWSNTALNPIADLNDGHGQVVQSQYYDNTKSLSYKLPQAVTDGVVHFGFDIKSDDNNILGYIRALAGDSSFGIVAIANAANKICPANFGWDTDSEKEITSSNWNRVEFVFTMSSSETNNAKYALYLNGCNIGGAAGKLENGLTGISFGSTKNDGTVKQYIDNFYAATGDAMYNVGMFIGGKKEIAPTASASVDVLLSEPVASDTLNKDNVIIKNSDGKTVTTDYKITPQNSKDPSIRFTISDFVLPADNYTVSFNAIEGLITKATTYTPVSFTVRAFNGTSTMYDFNDNVKPSIFAGSNNAVSDGEFKLNGATGSTVGELYYIFNESVTSGKVHFSFDINITEADWGGIYLATVESDAASNGLNLCSLGSDNKGFKCNDVAADGWSVGKTAHFDIMVNVRSKTNASAAFYVDGKLVSDAWNKSEFTDGLKVFRINLRGKASIDNFCVTTDDSDEYINIFPMKSSVKNTESFDVLLSDIVDTSKLTSSNVILVTPDGEQAVGYTVTPYALGNGFTVSGLSALSTGEYRIKFENIIGKTTGAVAYKEAKVLITSSVYSWNNDFENSDENKVNGHNHYWQTSSEFEFVKESTGSANTVFKPKNDADSCFRMATSKNTGSRISFKFDVKNPADAWSRIDLLTDADNDNNNINGIANFTKNGYYMTSYNKATHSKSTSNFSAEWKEADWNTMELVFDVITPSHLKYSAYLNGKILVENVDVDLKSDFRFAISLGTNKNSVMFDNLAITEYATENGVPFITNISYEKKSASGWETLSGTLTQGDVIRAKIVGYNYAVTEKMVDVYTATKTDNNLVLTGCNSDVVTIPAGSAFTVYGKEMTAETSQAGNPLYTYVWYGDMTPVATR